MSRVYSDPLLISSGLTCGSQRFSTPTLVPIYQQPKYSKYFNFIQKSPQNLDWKYLQIIKYKILKIMIMINSLQDHTKQQNYFHARLKKFIHMYATSLRQWSNARAVSARCSDLFDNFQFSSWNRKSTNQLCTFSQVIHKQRCHKHPKVLFDQLEFRRHIVAKLIYRRLQCQPNKSIVCFCFPDWSALWATVHTHPGPRYMNQQTIFDYSGSPFCTIGVLSSKRHYHIGSQNII